MPVEMQVPKKIPVGRAPRGEVKTITIDKLDDGSYEMTAISRSGGEPQRMSFKSIGEAMSNVQEKFGESAQAQGAVSGVMDKAIGGMAQRAETVRGEAQRRPTRPAGDQTAPAYAETQTNTAPDEEQPF